jgi:mono/diheme cytochrome c family protein
MVFFLFKYLYINYLASLFIIILNLACLRKNLSLIFEKNHSYVIFVLLKSLYLTIMMNKMSKKLIALLAVVFFFSFSVLAQEGDPAAGETLFKTNCLSCHNTNGVVSVGPGLKGIEERRDAAWIKKWVNNPAAVIASGDKYANDLYVKYNKLNMTAFPSFGDAEVKNILAYVKKSNEVVAVVPGPVPVGGGEDTGGGKFFTTIMIAMFFIMGLVLIALLAVLNLLNKLAKGDGAGDLKTTSFSTDNIKNTFKNLGANTTIRSAIIWLFVLLGTKATLDGMFSVGVHKGYAPKQPINFSHKLHAGEMQINCAYCHTGVYKGKQAGIPSASICMNCHNAIKRESTEIQKIYTAIEKNQPVEWVRVHNLPDLAYFNHSQHTNVGGLECASCHGEINKMEVVQQRSSLTMGWCIDCHRKTDVNAKGNAYYDALLTAHNATSKESMKVEDIGGLECAKCHY